MARTERPHEVRGARDLATLWWGLPVAVIAYPKSAWSVEDGLATLSDTLRGRSWREHCVSRTLESCAEQGKDCIHPGNCHGDALFPMKIGGGAPSWRMATLFVQWRPMLAQWHLIALGAKACDSLGWASRCLRERHGLEGGVRLPVSTLADLQLAGGQCWELRFVTPWIVGKGGQADAVTNCEGVTHELRKALRTRAHKISALCLGEEFIQRITGHLVHHVASTLLHQGLVVESAELESAPLALASRGNGSRFVALTWTGRVKLRVEPAVLPWLSLLALCGGGENADKGFGAVELIPVD